MTSDLSKKLNQLKNSCDDKDFSYEFHLRKNLSHTVINLRKV